MKRLLASSCVVIALAVCAVPANAQDVSVGLKAGPSFVTWTGDLNADVSSYARLAGGAFMVVRLGRNFAFQPELLYAQKGFKEGQPSDVMKLKLAYIELPLLVRVHPNVTGRFLPHVLAGPTIAYRVDCQLEGNDNGDVQVMDCDPMPIQELDLGAALGAGVDMAVGKAFVVFDLRYEFGLRTVDDDTSPDDVYNRAFSIMAGFRYPLGGYARTALR